MLTSVQILVALALAGIPAFFAVKLGLSLYLD